MSVITSHIRHLLIEQGTVALPGFGVFACVSVSASFSGNTLLPPAEQLSFRRDDSGFEDSDLKSSIMRREGVDAEEAARIIAAEVDKYNRLLSLGMPVNFAGVGQVSVNLETGDTEFEPAGDFCGRAVFPWFEPLELKPIDIAPAAAADFDDEEFRRRSDFLRTLRRTATTAAAVVVLVLIAFVAAQLPERASDSHPAHLASLPIEPISSLRVADESTALIDRPGSDSHALVLILNTPADAAQAPTPKPERKVADAGRYFLVVASLYSRAEADKFINSRGADAPELAVLEADGRYRVYAARGATIEDVRQHALAEQLYDSYPSAWICRN